MGTGDLSMRTEIIEDLKITISLPKKVLENLEHAGYLDQCNSVCGDLMTISYTSRRTLNKTIADMITREWK